MSTKPIWPGPECLKSKPWPRAGELVVFLDRRGDAIHIAPVLAAGTHFVEAKGPNGGTWLWTPSRTTPALTFGIAMCHAKARVRMRRFRAWLSDYNACAERAALMSGIAPESAVRAGSLCGLQWLATRVLHSRWRAAFREPVDVEAETRAMLASPEWASLPWQQ